MKRAMKEKTRTFHRGAKACCDWANKRSIIAEKMMREGRKT